MLGPDEVSVHAQIAASPDSRPSPLHPYSPSRLSTPADGQQVVDEDKLKSFAEFLRDTLDR